MNQDRKARVLTIAGSDSGCGAGIQLDLKIFQRLGVYGTCAVTALTAQNTQGVQKINKIARRIVAAQIDSVMKDIGADACKTGMLLDTGTVETVAERVRRRDIPNVIVDPVIFAKDGTALLSAKGLQRLKKRLLPAALVITPNAHEAEALSKVRIETAADLKEAAKNIKGLGCGWVLIKGGHLSGEPVDLLYDGENFIEFPGERIEGPPVHGTGCAFSAALAARIALGDTVPEAAEFAKDFTAGLIKKAIQLGKGALSIRT